jgi:ribosomal protein S27AE
MTQKCPKCGRWLAKNVEADHLIAGAYFYQCGHCGYVSELLTDGDLTFGENYPMFLEHNTNWANRKKYEIERLKKEHIKIINEMDIKYGYLTHNDKLDLIIDFYLFENEEKLKKKKKGNKNE